MHPAISKAVGLGPGGTLIFPYIRRLGPFGGGHENFEFLFFFFFFLGGGDRKMNILGV